MKIEEGNKLIAEFMGCKISKDRATCRGVKYTFPYNKNESKHLTHLAYNSSWDWLMPVVEKIEVLDDSKNHYSWFESEQTERSNFAGYSVLIECNMCTIDLNFELDPSECIFHTRAETKIEAVWQTVIRFIQRRNENSSSIQSQ